MKHYFPQVFYFLFLFFIKNFSPIFQALGAVELEAEELIALSKQTEEDLAGVPGVKPRPKKDLLDVKQLKSIIQDFHNFRKAVEENYDEDDPGETELEMDRIEQKYCGFFKDLMKKRQKQPTMDDFFKKVPSIQESRGNKFISCLILWVNFLYLIFFNSGLSFYILNFAYNIYKINVMFSSQEKKSLKL